MKRPLNPRKYPLQHDEIDLTNQRVFVYHLGRFHEIPSARIELIQSEPEQKPARSAYDEAEILSALL